MKFNFKSVIVMNKDDQAEKLNNYKIVDFSF